MDPSIKNRQLSPTWISTTYIGTQVMDFCVTFMRHFNWTAVYVAADIGSVPMFPAYAAMTVGAMHGTPIRPVYREVNSKATLQFHSLLTEFGNFSRGKSPLAFVRVRTPSDGFLR